MVTQHSNGNKGYLLVTYLGRRHQPYKGRLQTGSCAVYGGGVEVVSIGGHVS